MWKLKRDFLGKLEFALFEHFFEEEEEQLRGLRMNWFLVPWFHCMNISRALKGTVVNRLNGCYLSHKKNTVILSVGYFSI